MQNNVDLTECVREVTKSEEINVMQNDQTKKASEREMEIKLSHES